MRPPASIAHCFSHRPQFSNKDQNCNLPPVLLEGVKAYEAFYNVKHSGRILTFRPELGSVDVKAKFKARTHELSISTHCMCVLALFEGLGDEESLSYKVSARGGSSKRAPS